MYQVGRGRNNYKIWMGPFLQSLVSILKAVYIYLTFGVFFFPPRRKKITTSEISYFSTSSKKLAQALGSFNKGQYTQKIIEHNQHDRTAQLKTDMWGA